MRACRALVLLLFFGASYAQAPDLAVCKEGQCVMPETTYMQLKVLVSRMVMADQERQRKYEQQEHRADTCEAALRDART